MVVCFAQPVLRWLPPWAALPAGQARGWWPWGLGAPLPACMRANLHHDAMYEGQRSGKSPPLVTGTSNRKKRRRKRWTRARKWADKSMRQILKEDGCSWLKRWSMYIAVRVAGADSAQP